MTHNEFHSINRALYATLVHDLCRDPIEAIQMMAIWIWLQKMPMLAPDLVHRILSLSSHLINNVANEALSLWSCLDNISLLSSSSAKDFPFTNILLRQDMPVEFFRMHREITIAEINKVIKFVCAISFKDIWDGAIARNEYMQRVADPEEVDQERKSFMYPPMKPDDRKFFVHFSRGCPLANNHETLVPPQKDVVHPDDRTLFVTFSRGYPVAEREVRDFFTRLFGECIESFYMQEVDAGEHALFAKIVLYHSSYMHAILTSGTKAKFIINGKQVWMRKFFPKRVKK